MHLVCIACFALLLTSGLEGKTPINGDDVRVIDRSLIGSEAHTNYNYFKWTQSRLHIWSVLYANYKVAGESFEKGNLIWLGIYVLSAFAAYAYLSKIVSPSVALLGAIFYLSYSSKYEPLTWWGAGAYTLIWLTFFAMLWLLESKIRFQTKTTVIALLISASMHFYEVFTLLAPVFSALLLLRRKRELGALARKEIFFGLLPTLVVIGHIAILSTASRPIFTPTTMTAEKVPMLKRVAVGFTSALDATVGPLHFKTMNNAASSWRHFYRREHRELAYIFWIAICATVVTFLASFRSTLRSTTNLVPLREHAFIGLFALFISAFIGFITNFCVTPSRLTGIPSIGLMIALCCLIEVVFCLTRRLRGGRRLGALGVACALWMLMFFWAAREVEAFSALLRQAGEVHDLDWRIANKIKALHPKFGQDEEIFVRMPRAHREEVHAWTNFFSGFNSGRAFESFWYLYKQETGTSRFSCVPAGSPGEDVRMREADQGWQKNGVNKVIPFYVDRDENVFAIKRIDYIDTRGGIIKSADFSKQHEGVPANLQVIQRIPLDITP